MNYVMILTEGVTHTKKVTHKEVTHYHVDQARDQYSIAEAGLMAEEKERNEGNQTIFFTNSDADEAEAITDIKKPRKVNYQIHWRSEQNAEHWINLSATQEWISADSVQAIFMHQSIMKECVVKVVNKRRDENCSQDNLCLERTRSNTPKFWDHKNSDILRNPWETESKIADVELWPNSIRESQLGERGITKTSCSCR